MTNKTDKKASVTPMDLFHTRTKSGEGVSVPLMLPDGSPTEHWVKVRGVDSDEYRRADSRARRRALDIAQEKDDAKREDMIEDTKLDVLSVLVADWSFDRPCTQADVKEFLREAPQVADLVDKTAYKRALFFGKSSTPSSPTA
jgi:hypothetical protein